MKAVLAVVLLTVGLAASFYLDSPTKIVGGEQTTIDQYPYQLSLEQNLLGLGLWQFTCGAVIIGKNEVLTAGHCAQILVARNLRVRSGSGSHSNGDIHTATKITVHPSYAESNEGVPDFDIAYILVDPPFEFDENCQAINITNVEPKSGDNATITGWGLTSENGAAPALFLHTVTVPIVDRASCNVSYAEAGGITENMICAGLPEGGKDACSGDSGGPLTVNGLLAGLVSWGFGCAEEGYPGVYTNIAPLVAWVQQQRNLNV